MGTKHIHGKRQRGGERQRESDWKAEAKKRKGNRKGGKTGRTLEGLVGEVVRGAVV